jgi:hypothetical protein
MNRNKLRSILVACGTGAVAVICCWFLVYSLRARGQTAGEIREVTTKLDSLSKNAPSEERIKYLQDKKEQLQKSFDRALEAFSRQQATFPKDVPDPIQFKEKLFKVEEGLRRDALVSRIYLPDDMGFGDYENEIPRPGDVPMLVKELDVLQEIYQLAKGSGVAGMSSIEFVRVLSGEEQPETAASAPIASQTGAAQKGPVRPKPAGGGIPAKGTYKKETLRVEIDCDMRSLYNFLYGIRASKYILVTRGMSVRHSERVPGRLLADIEIEMLVFEGA